jgi:hypothetical protein
MFNRVSMIPSSLDDLGDLDDVSLDEQEMPATRRL